MRIAVLLASLLATPALAGAIRVDSAAAERAGAITRAQAISIAEKTLPNTTLLSAAFEIEDHIPHWTVDLLGSVNEYEVWVSTAGSVLRVITQPK